MLKYVIIGLFVWFAFTFFVSSNTELFISENPVNSRFAIWMWLSLVPLAVFGTMFGIVSIVINALISLGVL